MDLNKETQQTNLEIDEEFSFKALTNGLGFHHHQKPLVNSTGPRTIRTTPVRSNQVAVKKEVPKILLDFTSDVAKIEMGELSSFYNPAKREEVKQKREESVEEKRASSWEIFLSWTIDLFLILLLVLVTSVFLVITSGIEPAFLYNSMPRLEMVLYIGWLFLFYYMFYFCFLDSQEFSTVGKQLLRIKLRTEYGTTASVGIIFIRSLTTLTSLVLLGIPTLLDFQGKLTETKLLKR